jgi:hypothetical protein
MFATGPVGTFTLSLLELEGNIAVSADNPCLR